MKIGKEKYEIEYYGPVLPQISLYPYPDFLWPPEAEEGEEYKITVKKGENRILELTSIYEKINFLNLGPFSYIEIKENGEIKYDKEKIEFKKEIIDNYPGNETIRKMVENEKYEPWKFSLVSTKINDYYEKTVKNQIFDGNTYHKWIKINGVNNTPEIREVLTFLYPTRIFFPEFDKKDFFIEMEMKERVIKREKLENQIFEKLISSGKFNIKIVEEFSEGKEMKIAEI